MSAPAQIDIIATDKASDVFNEVSGNFSAMSSNISEESQLMGSAVSQSMQQSATSTDTMAVQIQADASEMKGAFQNASSDVQVSMGQIKVRTQEADEATQSSGDSFGKTAMQMNTMALSGATLVMGISNVENAETSLSRAHLVAEKAANSVTLAQQAYNLAVAKYGENSVRAHDAANKLSLAQQTSQVDAQRVDEAQRNYNNSLMTSALTVIPSVIGIITTLNSLREAGTLAEIAGTAASTAHTIATDAETAATTLATGAMAALDVVMDANPIVLVALAIAALTAGIVWAYENCKPFRDIVNDIGNVMKGALFIAFNGLKTASDDLWNGLKWAYDNILVPVGNFFKTIFVDELNVALIPVKAFESAIGTVANAVKPLTDFIGGLGNSLRNLCFAHAAPAAEEFNKQVTQSIALSDQLSHKTNTLGSSLMGLAGNVNVKYGSGTSNVTIGAPNITIGNVTGTASLKQTRDAVSKGICDAMYKKGIINKVM